MNLNINSSEDFKNTVTNILNGKGFVDGTTYDPHRISLDASCKFIEPGNYNLYVEVLKHCDIGCCYSYKLHVLPIKERRYEIEQQIQNANKSHGDKVKKLYKSLELLTKDCQHEWKYYPDPSGNNDSSYVCSICSKETKSI